MTPPLPSEQQLLDAARRTLTAAYSPYSRFRVGAALLDTAGGIHVGCNVENASLGLTLCAERCAIGAALAAGQREFTAIAIVTETPDPVWPCGACRQVLAEFAPDLPVVSAGASGEPARTTLGKLLPGQFRLDGGEPR